LQQQQAAPLQGSPNAPERSGDLGASGVAGHTRWLASLAHRHDIVPVSRWVGKLSRASAAAHEA
jgi:hypothetical protein